VNYSASINIPYSDMQWRMPFIIQLVPGALFILLMIPQPESPRWLVEQERYDEAARTLAYVVRTSVDDKAVLLTLDEIKVRFVALSPPSSLSSSNGLVQTLSTTSAHRSLQRLVSLVQHLAYLQQEYTVS
jgi:hypothetical protein